MPVTEAQVLDALRSVQDPDLHRDIVSLGFIKNLRIDSNRVAFTLELTTPACPVKDMLKAQAQEAVNALPGVVSVEVTMTASVRAAQAAPLAPTVKQIIPIASGKGGVGKSTLTVNLALALAQTGAKVGIMDGDVYGPSIPMILGIDGDPEVDEQNRIRPLEKHGIKVISMGFFMNPEEAVVWRGPMLHKTVQQFLGGVLWGELDYLLVDLPPGTGDVQLSLCQSIPISGAVIVSTPQPVALNVAQKAVAMFGKLNAPVLGIIENMRSDIFGSGGAEAVAQRLQIPFLGAIPLAAEVRQASDAGEPYVIQHSGEEAAKAFAKVAGEIAVQVSLRSFKACGAEGVRVTF